MTDPRSELDRVHIPRPCSADWSSMEGDERSRYCGECRLHVHDLAAHTREEAELLLARRHRGERVCVRVELDGEGRPRTLDDRPPARPGRSREAALALALGAGLLAACRDTPGPAPGAGPEDRSGACESELLGDAVSGDEVSGDALAGDVVLGEGALLGEPADAGVPEEGEASPVGPAPERAELLGRVAPGSGPEPGAGDPAAGEAEAGTLERLRLLGYVVDLADAGDAAEGEEACPPQEGGEADGAAAGHDSPPAAGGAEGRRVLMGTPGPSGPPPAGPGQQPPR